jgi:hypothetical protein
MVLGELIAFTVIFFTNPRYVKQLEGNNNIPVPEWRLPIAMVGAPLFAAGLFWFGWTGYSGTVHWIVPILSGLFTGFGIFSIFLSLLNYIVDSYLMFAASAIAANTFMRSIFGGIFPLFATYMFNGMGIQWASTVRSRSVSQTSLVSLTRRSCSDALRWCAYPCPSCFTFMARRSARRASLRRRRISSRTRSEMRRRRRGARGVMV